MLSRNYTIKNKEIVEKIPRKTLTIESENVMTGYITISLDQATNKSGYSIFVDGKLQQYGFFQTQSKDSTYRLHEVSLFLIYLINTFKPNKVIIEDVQIQRLNIKSGITLSKLLGILENTLIINKIPYEVVLAKTWKSSCNIKGRKREQQKENTRNFIKEKFEVIVPEDVADAIAINYHNVRKEKINAST